MERFRLGRQNCRRAHYARFDATEIARRHDAVRAVMRERGLDSLVVFGTAGFQQLPITYLTNYRPPFVTYYVLFADPDEPTLLLTGLSNHLQYVREVADADEVDVMLPDPAGKVADRIHAAGAAGGSTGLVSHDPRYGLSLPHDHYEALDTALDGELVNATAPFTRVTAVKSDPELQRIRQAADLTDLGLEVLAETAGPGVREVDLEAALDQAYLDEPGGLGVGFISSAPMEDAEPGEPLPWHKPSTRPIESGDVITTELSAAVGGYRSQVHRTFTVGRAPSATYEDLWAVAMETYEEMLSGLTPGATTDDLHAAMAPLEASPYKSYDVMLHGYGSGYQAPFVGTRGSNYWPGAADPLTADWTFEAGMVIVLQPNAVTPDETAGLQLGSAVVVREDGPEVLQEYPLPIQQV